MNGTQDKSEKVQHNGNIIAIIVWKGAISEGIEFFTPEDYPFQLGKMVHEKGSHIKPHVHRPSQRTIHTTQEMVRVDFGLVEVDFYTDDGKLITTRKLSEGDTVLFATGGHGFRFLEKSGLTEVKQGPYSGRDDDKEEIKVDNEKG